MVFDSIICMATAFALTCIFMPLGIPVLHRLKFGQNIREEGPEAHKKKSGTPTMGGIMFLLAIELSSLFFAGKYPMMIPVMIFTLLFGIIGFADDFLKVVKKKNEGLKSWQKFLLQFIITACFAFYLYRHPEIGTSVLLPFTGNFDSGKLIDLGIMYVPFVFIVVLGTDNGVNFTDGLDGLCASVTLVVALFFAAACIKMDIKVAPFSAAVAGGMAGFLIWNHYPAKVFMGDTGSLALGGFVASIALISRMPIFIAVVGFIYLAEVISVMLQVSYFKVTHGKRIFRMAPIHHHFELGGWKETKVVTVFTLVTILLCVGALICLN